MTNVHAPCCDARVFFLLLRKISGMKAPGAALGNHKKLTFTSQQAHPDEDESLAYEKHLCDMWHAYTFPKARTPAEHVDCRRALF